MKLREFEALLEEFGSDISGWPENKRLAAAVVCETEKGRMVLAAELALTSLIAAGRAVGPEKASDGNSDAFLDRLDDIPAANPQSVAPLKSSGTTLWADLLADYTFSWRSPTAIASQLGGVVAIVGVGIFVGMNSDGSQFDMSEDIYGTIDISETLFVSGAALPLDDE